ncbi:MAG: hypothetical protein EBZ67_10640 [Chitinophagia bacterium]|nr:hypothetical protein [Chitinophagia bacterium]
MHFGKILLLTAALMAVQTSQRATAQGCVAIRGAGGANCSLDHGSPDSSGWLLSINNRYFKSFRHYVGTVEQKERMENGTEVINHTFSTDIFVQRTLNRRWALAVNIPIVNNARSSLYEHGGNTGGPKARNSTHSFGLGDMRVAAYAWIWDPQKQVRWNIQAGLGLKLPTGDYRYQDYFVRNDTTRILGPVDQSIQLGDGGTGFTAEVNAFYLFTPRISAYLNGFYLANPREHNGVSTARGGVPTAIQIASGSNVMSVPDQYMYRAGLNYMVNRMNLSAGIRRECIPVRDLIGGSNGFRRPGYVLSVEPGVSYQGKRVVVFALVPVAIVRNRTQSVPDKIRTQRTGVYTQGDAAFADYAVNAGMVIRF